MSGGPRPREVDVEEVSSRLSEALASCRSMVSSYRAMLGGRVLAEHRRREPRQPDPPGAA